MSAVKWITVMAIVIGRNEGHFWNANRDLHFAPGRRHDVLPAAPSTSQMSIPEEFLREILNQPPRPQPNEFWPNPNWPPWFYQWFDPRHPKTADSLRRTETSSPNHASGDNTEAQRADVRVRSMIMLPTNHTIRLHGGRLPHEGFLEMKIQGKWQSLCGDAWDQRLTAIACDEMGFTRRRIHSKEVSMAHQSTWLGHGLPERVKRTSAVHSSANTLHQHSTDTNFLPSRLRVCLQPWRTRLSGHVSPRSRGAELVT